VVEDEFKKYIVMMKKMTMMMTMKMMMKKMMMKMAMNSIWTMKMILMMKKTRSNVKLN
jgi:hypothetical protein